MKYLVEVRPMKFGDRWFTHTEDLKNKIATCTFASTSVSYPVILSEIEEGTDMSLAIKSMQEQIGILNAGIEIAKFSSYKVEEDTIPQYEKTISQLQSAINLLKAIGGGK